MKALEKPSNKEENQLIPGVEENILIDNVEQKIDEVIENEEPNGVMTRQKRNNI